ncbi:ribonuclease E [Sesbania bispinosa]|nr:ribonuclease E [Sesbania bispinosa]
MSSFGAWVFPPKDAIGFKEPKSPTTPTSIPHPKLFRNITKTHHNIPCTI